MNMDQTNVGNLNGFYGRQYSADDLQRLAQVNSQQAMMGMIGHGGMGDMAMVSGQTLDEIISQNNKEIARRRSYHRQYGTPRSGHDTDPRRASMLEFGSGPSNDLDCFQFDPSPVQAPVPNTPTSHPHGGGIAQRRLESRRAEAQRRVSNENLGLNTQFQDITSGFGPMTHSPVYQQGINAAESLNLDVGGGYMPQNLGMGMDFTGSVIDQDIGGEMTPMNMYTQGSYTPSMTTSPIHQNLSTSMQNPTQDPGGGGTLSAGAEQDMMEKMPNMNMSDQIQPMRNEISLQTDMLQSTNGSGTLVQTTQDLSQSPSNTHRLDLSSRQNLNTFLTGDPLPDASHSPNIPHYRNAYSSSGFDMLGVLMRVAARPKPQINIGAVDMSCAFVVCDVTQHDLPIVYCSDVFERLTGYNKHEILGRNCRFLQAPDGKVTSGIKRKYVDDQAVLHLKNMITQRQEAQISLINYRKGGQPFMNLLTMIPITYNSDEIKYYVGFQVDLVEQPTSITNKNPDGSYAINYQRGLLPRYVFNTPESNSQREAEMGQTIGRDEVSTVLSTIGSGESELSKRIWDKVLLENTDDVVHVLSLKGLFLYLSPSSRKILEYDPHELVGTALSSVCHPSDIVPVTRELKDTSTGAAVNVVFRIRRKHSGYTWFESHGSLHTEQGKGKKCIILVGRERPVYALQRSDIDSAGGIGESELWTKMSTSGMFLFVSSTNVKSMLDRLPDELVGTSAQALMRPDAKLEFGRMLELARTGLRATFKHDVQNKRGQTLHAQTTIYPGDATEGQKPTFLVAQTRLLKPSRNSAPPSTKNNTGTSGKADPGSGGSNTPSTGMSGPTQVTRRTEIPPMSMNNPYGEAVVTQPGCSGLAIGNQHEALASEDNVFDELKTTRSTSWQFELRQMEKRNRLLAEELQSLQSNKKKRKRRKGAGQQQKDCANCHTRSTPEWRRGPSGNRDLCNSCGLRWAKQNGRVSPRTSSQQSDKQSAKSSSPANLSPLTGNGEPHPSSMIPGKKSPQTQNVDSHNAKTARMEAAASHGYGGGIPAKIEEDDEPIEKIPATR